MLMNTLGANYFRTRRTGTMVNAGGGWSMRILFVGIFWTSAAHQTPAAEIESRLPLRR
jgi:hypothetical protein